MKYLGLLLLPLIASAHELRLNESRLLYAIAAVESGANDAALGPCGEISRYQMMPATWQAYSLFPVSRAHDPIIAEAAALAYIRSIKAEVCSESPYIIALAWAQGPNARGFSRAKHDHAKRVENLYFARD